MLDWRKRWSLGILIVVACTPGCQENRQPTPQTLPKKSDERTVVPAEVIAAYESVGGTYGSWGPSTHELSVFRPNRFPPKGETPGFCFLKRPQGAISRLAPVGGPFCLKFAHSDITQEDLRDACRLLDIVALDVSYTQFSDDWIPELEALSNLHTLVLSCTKIEGKGLAGLAKLPNLKVLHLASTKMGDEHLPHLAGLTNLEMLELGGNSVTDVGLKKLSPLQRLTLLGLAHTQVTDAGLAELANFPNLASLYLHNSPVTGQGLAKLAPLKKLNWLVLDLRAQPCDAGIEALRDADLLHALAPAQNANGGRPRNAKDVVNLDLSQTVITDKGLLALTGLENLVSLDLRGCPVTEAGVARLQKSLPQCAIRR